MQRPNTSLVSPLDHFHVTLKSLENNKINDKAEKDIAVWRPAGTATEGLPLLICLASYLNSGPSLTAWRNFGETIPERLDRLFEQEKLPPCVVVFIDSYNRLGGTQFVNSPVLGNWVNALADDLVPMIETKYGCGGEGGRALFGHSSGGYGALYNLCQRPDIWAAAASHAGDCGFDFVYRNELPKALRVLSAYGFDFTAFLDEFWQQEKPKGEQISALMMMAMAASYDPDDSPLGIRLPVTHDTCLFIKERWENWLSHDLLTVIPEKLDTLRHAKAIYFDCGSADEYNILYGTRQMAKILQDGGIAHRFEEFIGGHGTIGPRYEISLPWLIEQIT